MNNKEKNRKKQQIYKRRRIVVVCMLVILAVILIVSIQSKLKLKKIALGENALNLGGNTIDLNQVLSQDPNPPHLGAGMIPIKWNNDEQVWEITSKDDPKWYDYANGKWANVMLSDGEYSAELERDKKLASDYVGASIARPDQLGTIFTWVPRLAYLEDNVSFLKGTSIVEYMYTTEECFNLIGYGANSLDLGFEGIWVGQAELGDTAQVEQKNNEMNSKENTYGLIANEKVQLLTPRDKTAVEKLYSKYKITDNQTILQNIETMQNRQTIKIVNTNKRIPISGTHQIVGGNIIVGARYNENKIAYCTDKNGNKLENTHIAPINEEETNYTFYILDEIGNIRRYAMSYGSGRPYLKGFNKNNTFYVVYDDAGNETSEIPIGETAPSGWYSYNNQRWANIVVRDNGNTSYYTWIPRYMYKLDSENQKVDARLVDLENKDAETGKSLAREGYILPDAFTWEDPENTNAKVQLSGFWASKYKLRDGVTEFPDISGGSGIIRINNIAEATDTNYICEIYLIKDGKRIVFDENTLSYREGTTPETLSGNYRYTKLEEGTYTVNIIIKNAETKIQEKAITKQVEVKEATIPNAPDLTGFNKNNTFYVTYNEQRKEESYIPIGENIPNNWYDYADQKWANIVVRENGNESYYTWIPRYEYKLDTGIQKTNALFISVDKQSADDGYTIPDAFTWEYEENGQTKQKALSGFWASKYKLREGTNETIDISGGNGIINVGSIAEATDANYVCEAYLIKDGKRIGNAITLAGNYRYTDLEAGTYSVNIIVKNATTNIQEKAITRQVDVAKSTKPNVPDLTGFNEDNTFYVVYDEAGNETSNIPIKELPPTGWYDYTEQKWANIVVKDNNGNINYFTWIPRYEYKVDTDIQKTNVLFIPEKKLEADDGYTIPDAFTWEYEENGQTKKKALSGFWASKYKLREGTTTNSISTINTTTESKATTAMKQISQANREVYRIINNVVTQI